MLNKNSYYLTLAPITLLLWNGEGSLYLLTSCTAHQHNLFLLCCSELLIDNKRIDDCLPTQPQSCESTSLFSNNSITWTTNYPIARIHAITCTYKLSQAKILTYVEPQLHYSPSAPCVWVLDAPNTP